MASGTISFELSTDITYVAGTVNGVETVFIQDEAYPVKWRATVDVAEDSLYHIYLEMYDEQEIRVPTRIRSSIFCRGLFMTAHRRM